MNSINITTGDVAILLNLLDEHVDFSKVTLGDIADITKLKEKLKSLL